MQPSRDEGLGSGFQPQLHIGPSGGLLQLSTAGPQRLRCPEDRRQSAVGPSVHVHCLKQALPSHYTYGEAEAPQGSLKQGQWASLGLCLLPSSP